MQAKQPSRWNKPEWKNPNWVRQIISRTWCLLTHGMPQPSPILVSVVLCATLIGISTSALATPQPATISDNHTLELLKSSGSESSAGTVSDTVTLPYEQHFSPPTTWNANDDLVIEGHNPSDRQALLVIRLDDVNSTGYSSRVNEERDIPPGPFRLRIALASLLTAEKKRPDLSRLTALYLFTAQPQGITLQKLSLQRGLRFSDEILAWDFGDSQRAPFSGFTRIGPQDAHLQGRPTATTRSGSFAPFNDGLRGVNQIKIPLPAGQYQLRLWNRDPGEWELLPHPLERRVRVNGQAIWEQHLTPEQWIKDIYLAGRNQEALSAQTTQPQSTTNTQEAAAQQLLPEQLGKLSTRVTHLGGDLIIDLEGDSPDAQYISALLLWPDTLRPDTSPSAADTPTPEQQLSQRLTQLFHENWHINPQPLAPEQAISLALPSQDVTPNQGANSTAKAVTLLGKVAGNSHLNVDLKLETASLPHAVNASLHLSPFVPAVAKNQADHDTSITPSNTILPAELRWGQWHWVREPAQGHQLHASASYLRTDLDSAPLTPGSPRYLHLVISVPEGTPAGDYQATLQLQIGEQRYTYPLQIQVLALQLPDVPIPVGVYLDAAPHLNWFDAEQATRQSACDLRWLANIGLSIPAPALATPDDQNAARFERDLRAAMQSNRYLPLLAYTPLKRLRDNLGDKAAIMHIAEVEREHPQVLAWSLADEADSGQISNLLSFAQELRTRVPDIQLAGQLNHPSHTALLPALSLVLINDGFGASAHNITQLQKEGKQVWLYNLGASRLAAGFYLWRSGAQGYLQWHARMPTADPLNPVDGREADFQFLYPPMNVCTLPDTDRSLFALLEGTDDLRWLHWLDSQSQHMEAARLLRDKIWQRIPDTWQAAQQLSPAQLQQWRREIQQLAN